MTSLVDGRRNAVNLSTLRIALLCIGGLRCARGDIVVISLATNSTRDVFLDLPATFGMAIPDEGILGRYRLAYPDVEACEALDPVGSATDIPVHYKAYDPNHTWIALIRKGRCDYKTKITNAMLANYSAAIIYNVGSNRLELMRCKGSGCSNLIPSMFVGADDGLMLQTYPPESFLLFLTEDLPFDLNKYLLPFAVVVGVCFLILLIFMIYKCIRDGRRARRHRMPRRALKKIPQIKFRKGDPYEICAICLDEYVEGDKLRVLNCSHAYHCKCVDPWLTKSRRVCPICKRKVFASDERHRANDTSSSEEEDEGIRTGSRAQESAPLLPSPPASSPSRRSSRSRFRAFNLFGRTAATNPTSDATRPNYGAARRVDESVESPLSSEVNSDHSINGDSVEFTRDEHHRRDSNDQRGPQIV